MGFGKMLVDEMTGHQASLRKMKTGLKCRWRFKRRSLSPNGLVFNEIVVKIAKCKLTIFFGKIYILMTLSLSCSHKKSQHGQIENV